jgi:hypothetical protein
MNRLVRVLASGVFAAIACVCSTSLAASSVTTAERQAVRALWSYHIAVVRAAVRSKGVVDLKSFTGSIEALERITGVKSNTGTWAGRVPTRDLLQTVSEWEQWFNRRGKNLRLHDFGCTDNGRLPD